jgi:pullulanase
MFSDIDEKYYYPGDDLGASYTREQTLFKVWAPLADAARIHLYKSCKDEKPFRKLPMSKGKDGVWSKIANGNLSGVYYTYVFTYDDIESETIDIYARSCGANGAMGYIFDERDVNPPGWDETGFVRLEHYTDACVYELHVRDFSIDSSGNFCYKGRFLAFIEKHLRNAGGDKIGLSHLKELGITHVQLQPIFDFQTVDETDIHRPQFNWGYDPQNFNCPEGSYSTNPYNGAVRVNELKRLVQALHKNGIGVIMDVVYNHTYATADSCFTKTFPKYYYRQWGEHYANGSGCGNEIATERKMVRKYIIDSLCYYAKHYKIDGFRFDLMGLYDTETLGIAEEKLRAINPSVILYGEGWTGGDSPLEFRDRAMKLNARAVPAFGFFSDDFRDTVKGNNFVNRDKGYVNGAVGTEYYVREVMSGRIPHPQLPGMSKYSWTDTPCQTVNYVEAHDNLTLWDKLFYTNPTDTEDVRKKMDKLAAAMVFLAQGIPFIQAGQDFLRSKPLPGGNSFDHNSYNSPDIINSLKWDRKNLYRDVFAYYKGLIEFRRAHPILRMFAKEQVEHNLRFFDNLPSRVVGFGLYNEPGCPEILVFLNADEYPVKLFAYDSYDVYIDGDRAGTVPLYTVAGDYEIAGISAMVLCKKTGEA